MKRLLFLMFVMMAVYAVVQASSKKVGSSTFTVSPDTLNDTASGTGKAIASDTVYFSNVGDADVVFGKVIVRASDNSNRGYGLSDSSYMYVYTNIFGTATLLYADSANAVPTTYTIKLTAGDTLFGDNVYAIVTVSDTTSDTVMTATHKIDWELFFRNGQ